MNADPTVDAARWYDRLEREDRLFSAGRISAEQDIKEGFALYFAGNSRATVPYVTYSSTRGAIVAEMLAERAARDALDSHDGEASLEMLLQGTMSIEYFRSVLVQQHIRMWAEQIAQERAINDDGWSDDE